ncbi:acetyl-CoA carboxylase carboxyl transferase beta subunit/acetyl-CoA carboxylase carboxyl transferase alpha subunit [Lachnospiraceae bacterium PM6-15]|uniref:acetyl-CoA carboxylase carboxyltransferase subunit alpha n=1 Tax=Ohessyouella blattaphilus TaxID=2949333 RepID=UPI003E2698CF
MQLTNVFKKTKTVHNTRKTLQTIKQEKPEVPEGLLRKCNKCGAAIITDDVKENFYTCPKCEGYFRVHARRRIEMVADSNSFVSFDDDLVTKNPLNYPKYEDKIAEIQTRTSLQEAVITGSCQVEGNPAIIGVMDGRFLMASMGQVVGEKITRAAERATKENLPLILFACSGGARMQEGIVSLMQMTKTSAALKRHSDSGNLFISVLTDPTTGGVTASFAMLGDIILAEPGALIGFAGPRVIEQTIGQKLPKGFQRAEFLKEHGFVDKIVARPELKKTLAEILSLHSQTPATLPTAAPLESASEVKNEIAGAWDRVLLSRMKDRPVGEDYLTHLFEDFTEFHGDRYYGDDEAIIGGVARFKGLPVTVIAQAKGKDTKENIRRNFGMPSPEGYRKALRLMKQAEKFGRPIICFVDTPGAFCGLEAEERGQGEAIARNLYEMSALKVPILSIVIGEGGSGGALAMATANEVWMLENAIYSILSPEGFASILWKDASLAKEAAEVMKLTAKDLLETGIIEQVIEEPGHFTLQNLGVVTKQLEQGITRFLQDYQDLSGDEISERRYQRFREM